MIVLYRKGLFLGIAAALFSIAFVLFLTGHNVYAVILFATTTAVVAMPYGRMSVTDTVSSEELDELFKYRTEASEAILACDEVLSTADDNTVMEFIRQNISDYLELSSKPPKTSEEAQQLIHENARIASNIRFRTNQLKGSSL